MCSVGMCGRHDSSVICDNTIVSMSLTALPTAYFFFFFFFHTVRSVAATAARSELRDSTDTLDVALAVC